MHEIGITRDFVDQIDRQIKDRADINRVSAVNVRLGNKMDIPEEVLTFWFQQFSGDTKLKGAQVRVSMVDGNVLDVESLEIE